MARVQIPEVEEISKLSATARKIEKLESELRATIAMLWVAANKQGGEIHITIDDLNAMPRGAQLEQKKTTIGVKVIALDPWKRDVAFDLDVTDAPTEQELVKEFDRPDLDESETADATGYTPTTM